MMLQQPVDPVRAAAFLVSGQRENEVAVWSKPFFPEADEIGDQDGIAVFNVHGAATVKIALLFDKLKGIRGPVLAARLYDIEVSEKKNWFALACPAQASYQIFLAVIWPGNNYIFVRKTCGAQVRSHRFGCGRDVADGIGSVYLDELLEDLAGELICAGLLLAESRRCEPNA